MERACLRSIPRERLVSQDRVRCQKCVLEMRKRVVWCMSEFKNCGTMEIETFGERERSMTDYVTSENMLPTYLMFPRFLLKHQALSETEKLVYVLLLDRARLSLRHSKWVDSQGRAFQVYPLQALAKDLGKSEMTIKTSLRALEREGLLERRRQGPGKASLLYIKLPVQKGEERLPMRGTRSEPPERQNSTHQRDRKLSANKNKGSKNKQETTKEQEGRVPYGCYGNVMLSAGEVERLREKIPNWEIYVDKLSAYMQSSGKEYRDHAATIVGWAMRDGQTQRDYQCKEEESL